MMARAGGQSDIVEFDPAFLSGGSGRSVDLRRFSGGNALPPGTYRADVSLNDKPLGSFDVELRVDRTGRQNEACIDDAMLRRLGLDPAKAPEALRRVLTASQTQAGAAAEAGTGSKCRLMAEVADGATARFDPSEQRLDLSIPQLYLIRSVRGYVAPERWDNGIDAGLLNYHYSDFRNGTPSGGVMEQRFLGLRAGINLGAWRLRHDSALSAGDSGRHYHSADASLQRDITPLLSTLTLGDTYMDGQLFDSVGLRGVQVASDDRMLPESMRGYAPVIRGEARTNARVTIRQNGTVVYETAVPPGPFALTDLFAMSAGTDLQVTITEADGSQRLVIVPYSPMPQLLREGTIRWSAAIGQLRNIAAPAGAPVLQATFQRGFSNAVTAEGGIQLSRDYAALLAGGAFNTPVGAFALDATLSRFDAPLLGLRQGASFRASYAKYLPLTLTNFTFVAYRHSTPNYYSLSEAMQQQRDAAAHTVTADTGRTRERAVLAVNQELGSSKSMTLSAYSQNYWNRPGYDRSFQVAFGLRVGPASVGVSLARSLPAPGTIASTRALVTLSMPLGRGTSWTTTSQLVRDSGVGSSLQAGASGTLGDDNEYGININGSRDAAGAGSASLGGSYRGSAMTVSGSLTRAGGILQTAFTADGGLVAHGGGVTFSSTLGDSVGLVYAPSAPGASVLGAPGSEVNSSGYAIVPYLTPYNLNSIELDMKNAPLDTQLDTTVEQAVPRAGAVVRIDFKGRRGRNVLIEARADDGKALPFSATVLDESGRAVGLVGQGGRIEANVAEDAGRLTVRWGDEPSDQCTLSYRLPAPDGHKAVDFARTEAVCRQAQGAMYPQTSLNEGTR